MLGGERISMDRVVRRIGWIPVRVVDNPKTTSATSTETSTTIYKTSATLGEFRYSAQPSII